MNFVDAAVEILRQANGPLPVEEVCRLAIEQQLLSRPGKNPLRSMKGRLTTEAKKGDQSRVVATEKDVWTLRDGVAAAEAPSAKPKSKSKPKAKTSPKSKSKSKPSSKSKAKAKDTPNQEPRPELDAILTPPQRTLRADEAEVPDEDTAAELYADEVAEATEPQLAFEEYSDEQTEDEDRTLQPEITPPKRGGRRDRGDRKRRRRDKDRDRGKDKGQEKSQDKGRERKRRSRGRGKRDAVPTTDVTVVALDEAVAVPGRSELVRGAEQALNSVKGGQPVPVKQLFQMMRKRNLVSGAAERVGAQLRAALLADETAHRNRGLLPPIVHQGRGLFALTAWIERDPAVEQAERQVVQAVAALNETTEKTVRERLRALPAAGIERVAYLLLEANGWTDINWVKRVDRVSYATGNDPATGAQALIGVWQGGGAVPRRGVGELRAGVAAKELINGLLLAPAELDDSALAELGRDGKPIAVVSGDALMQWLVRSNLGVSQRMIAARVPDDSFFAALVD